MRQQIRADIESIVPLDALEQQDIADCLAWIDSGVELCRLTKPATPPMHLVSYVAVVDDGHILLVDHRNAQLWLPAGGHVDPGEHPRATVTRELEEELGFTAPHPVAAPLLVTVTGTVGLTAGHTDVSLWYVVHARRDGAMTFDEREFDSVRWFAFDAVPFERSDPQMRRFLAKLVAQANDAQQVRIAFETPDQADVHALIGELDTYLYSLYPPENVYAMDVASLLAPGVLFAVARDAAGVALGCAALVLQSGFGEIKRMYVRPQARGQGVARQLISRLEAKAMTQGCCTFMLETGPTMAQALLLYERLGYRRCGPFGAYPDDPLSVFMEKTVA